mgnify:CR=1 FL=1
MRGCLLNKPRSSFVPDLGIPMMHTVGVPGPRLPMAAQRVELLDEVADAHAEFVVTKYGRPVARLVPIDAAMDLLYPWDCLLAEAGLEPPTPFTLAHSYDGYTTNVPTADLIGGKAMVALRYEGKPIPPDHGGPARLLVPHLYFWKSAKWINGLQFTAKDELGFWELRGYHRYGDPWKEQRYTNDD